MGLTSSLALKHVLAARKRQRIDLPSSTKVSKVNKKNTPVNTYNAMS